MKHQELILDILGIAILLFSIYGFYFLETGFFESSAIGVGGLSLFVLKGSSIRKLVVSAINKYTKK